MQETARRLRLTDLPVQDRTIVALPASDWPMLHPDDQEFVKAALAEKSLDFKRVMDIEFMLTGDYAQFKLGEANAQMFNREQLCLFSARVLLT